MDFMLPSPSQEGCFFYMSRRQVYSTGLRREAKGRSKGVPPDALEWHESAMKEPHGKP